MAYMREHGFTTIEPTPEAVNQWQDQVAQAAAATLLSTVKSSWYLGANVPGKPQVFMPYAGGMARYRQIADGIAAKNYDGFRLTGESTTQSGSIGRAAERAIGSRANPRR
jgi:hypothetical protein